MKAFTFLQQTRFIKGLRALHEDEDGLEAIQIVMIVAIAALVLIAMGTFGQDIIDWAKEKFQELRGTSFDGG